MGVESLDNMSDQDLINSQVRLNTLQFLHSQQISKAKQEQLISKHKENQLAQAAKAHARQKKQKATT